MNVFASPPRPEAWCTPARAPQTRPRVLIAPIAITPTKPLTPSHVKFILWVDVLYRATSRVASVDYLYGHTTGNACQQTLGFWEYLDRTVGDTDYTAWSELAIGERYVQYQAEATKAPGETMRSYLDAYEHDGWIHAASARLLSIWSQHYATLGAYDPGLTQHLRPRMGLEELIDTLRSRSLCLDMRAISDDVYLDATAHGLPLRKLVTANGLTNYLACTLRDIVPLIPHYDQIILMHDREVTADYVLLQRVIGELGGSAKRIAIDRVAINGVVRSGRHGGWAGYTVPELAALCSAVEDPEAFRLGLRLFFVATIGIGACLSFDSRLLRRRIRKAKSLLTHVSPVTTEAELCEFLGRFTGRNVHVNPYRLTTSLLVRGSTAPIGDLVRVIFL